MAAGATNSQTQHLEDVLHNMFHIIAELAERGGSTVMACSTLK